MHIWHPTSMLGPSHTTTICYMSLFIFEGAQLLWPQHGCGHSNHHIVAFHRSPLQPLGTVSSLNHNHQPPAYMFLIEWKIWSIFLRRLKHIHLHARFSRLFAVPPHACFIQPTTQGYSSKCDTEKCWNNAQHNFGRSASNVEILTVKALQETPVYFRFR